MSGVKPVQRLFTEKTGSIFIYPLKLVWLEDDDSDAPLLRVLLAVPKKRFRKANERNRIKRILREVYRKNAWFLKEHLTSKARKMDLSISYVGEKEIEGREVERIFLSIAERFVRETNQTP